MTFDPEKDIPALTGKVIIVTGGSSGLGKETVLQLAKHEPERICLTARTQKRGDAAIQEVENEVPSIKGKLAFIPLDLSSFASIKQAAETFQRQFDRLDVLINNAGLMAIPEGLSEDGYESQFAANYLGPALFTKLLLPVLESTAAKQGSDVRIVNLSSELFKQAPKEGILFSKLKTPLSEMGSVTRYGQSKLADYFHTKFLAQKYPNIKCVAVHPGLVATGILDGWRDRTPILGTIVRTVVGFVAMDVHQGARAQLWASTASPEKVRSGGFYKPSFKEYTEKVLQNESLATELWDWTEKEFQQHGF